MRGNEHINFTQEFSRFFSIFMKNLPETLTLENAEILKDLFVNCRNNFNEDQYRLLWTLIAQDLPSSIRNGLRSDFILSINVCHTIELYLRKYCPSMLYGSPIDESVEDWKRRWNDLSKHQKKSLMALGAAGIMVPSMMNISYEVNHDNYQPHISYQNIDRPDSYKTSTNTIGDFTKTNIIPAKVDSTGMVHMSDAGMKKLMSHEKFRSRPYFPTKKESEQAAKLGRNDNVGKTIGFGHKINKNDSEYLRTTESITFAEALGLYKKDMRAFEVSFNKDIRMLENGLNDYSLYTQGFVDGMLSYMYNCGATGFINSDVYRAWKDCYVTEYNMLDRTGLTNLISTLSLSKIIDPGHRQRRRIEAELVRDGYTEYIDETFEDQYENEDYYENI